MDTELDEAVKQQRRLARLAGAAEQQIAKIRQRVNWQEIPEAFQKRLMTVLPEGYAIEGVNVIAPSGNRYDINDGSKFGGDGLVNEVRADFKAELEAGKHQDVSTRVVSTAEMATNYR